jgi:hypothetical protein
MPPPSLCPHAAATLWLLQHGADITKCKEDGWKDTILHYAAGSGSLGCAQVLVAHGADPSQANALGECATSMRSPRRGASERMRLALPCLPTWLLLRACPPSRLVNMLGWGVPAPCRQSPC